jgi:hypothetical protein
MVFTKKQSYTAYTDSLIIDPSLIKKKKTLFSQYYLLKDQLKKYRQIEKKKAGIALLPDGLKTLKLEIVSTQVRKRLFLDGFLKPIQKSQFMIQL